MGCMKVTNLKVILCLEPESYRVCGLADIDFGNFKHSRRSVECALITIGGFLVNWHVTKNETLSDRNNKAENEELSKLAKHVIFFNCY